MNVTSASSIWALIIDYFPPNLCVFFVVCTSSSSMLLRYVLITTIGQNDANKDLLRNGSVHTFIDKGAAGLAGPGEDVQ